MPPLSHKTNNPNSMDYYQPQTYNQKDLSSIVNIETLGLRTPNINILEKKTGSVFSKCCIFKKRKMHLKKRFYNLSQRVIFL